VLRDVANHFNSCHWRPWHLFELDHCIVSVHGAADAAAQHCSRRSDDHRHDWQRHVGPDHRANRLGDACMDGVRFHSLDLVFKTMLTFQTCDYWHSRHLLDSANPSYASRPSHRLLLYPVLFGGRQSNLRSNLSEHRRSDEEVDYSSHDFRGLGSWKHGRSASKFDLGSMDFSNSCQIFQSSDAPRYKKGFTVHFCLYILFNIVLAILRVLLSTETSRRGLPLLRRLQWKQELQVMRRSHMHLHSMI
jgi:hypothetical protein